MAFGLFKKKKKSTSTKDRYHTLRIKEVVEVASEAVNLVFEPPGADFHYQPGQFITIIKEINGKKIRRAYSLCSTPFADEFPTVTVKRVPGGVMSNHINDEFKAGDQIEVMEPMGMFTTNYDLNATRRAIFFGGGSGITPLYSLLRSVLIKEPQSSVALVYGNRSEDYIVFKRQLEELKAQYPDRFDLIHILEEDPSGYAQYTGRPTPEMIGQIADQLKVTPDTECYICGPEPMMDVTAGGLKTIGIKEEQIRMESFEAGKTSPADVQGDEATKTSGASEVTIILEGEAHTISVDKNTAILDAGLDQDLDMPYSCQSGLCTACRAKCLEGELDQEEAEGLTKEEEAEGYVLLCIGKPISDKIKVEVG